MATLAQRLAVRFRRLDHVVEGESAFQPGPGYWVDGREVAHLDDDRVLDLRLTRQVIRERRSELEADFRVTVRRGSDWVEVRFRTMADVEFAAELMEAAVTANRPPPGVTITPPPTGTDLARRRRFH